MRKDWSCHRNMKEEFKFIIIGTHLKFDEDMFFRKIVLKKISQSQLHTQWSPVTNMKYMKQPAKWVQYCWCGNIWQNGVNIKVWIRSTANDTKIHSSRKSCKVRRNSIIVKNFPKLLQNRIYHKIWIKKSKNKDFKHSCKTSPRSLFQKILHNGIKIEKLINPRNINRSIAFKNPTKWPQNQWFWTVL